MTEECQATTNVGGTSCRKIFQNKNILKNPLFYNKTYRVPVVYDTSEYILTVFQRHNIVVISTYMQKIDRDSKRCFYFEGGAEHVLRKWCLRGRDAYWPTSQQITADLLRKFVRDIRSRWMRWVLQGNRTVRRLINIILRVGISRVFKKREGSVYCRKTASALT